MKKRPLYVINVALQRPDGKVEQDTLFSENLPTQEQADGVSERFQCGVILNAIGTVTLYADKKVKECSFVSKKGVQND